MVWEVALCESGESRGEREGDTDGREGAGLTLSWALPGPRGSCEKGDKEVTTEAGGGMKTDPTVLNLGIGVIKKGKGPACPSLLGGGGSLPLTAILLGSLAPAPPLSLLDSCPFPLFIYCTNLSYSPQPGPSAHCLGNVACSP